MKSNTIVLVMITSPTTSLCHLLRVSLKRNCWHEKWSNTRMNIFAPGPSFRISDSTWRHRTPLLLLKLLFIFIKYSYTNGFRRRSPHTFYSICLILIFSNSYIDSCYIIILNSLCHCAVLSLTKAVLSTERCCICDLHSVTFIELPQSDSTPLWAPQSLLIL